MAKPVHTQNLSANKQTNQKSADHQVREAEVMQAMSQLDYAPWGVSAAADRRALLAQIVPW